MLIRAKPEFSVQYGLTLCTDAIDPSYVALLNTAAQIDAAVKAIAGAQRVRRLERAEHAFDVPAPDNGFCLGDEGAAGVALGELEVDVRVAVDAHHLGRGPDALLERLLNRGRHTSEQL